MAAYPITIAMLLISRTKVLTEVVGMLKTSSGKGPTRLWPRYTRYVEMRDPKKRQSEPRNNHMSIFRWLKPVVVSSTTGPWPTEVGSSNFAVPPYQAGFISPLIPVLPRPAQRTRHM